jgi:alpha-1,3-glucosyltransferase
MLALTLLSVLCFKHNWDLLGCIAFSCSLCFKQMALYYSPAVFAYLLGKCIWLGGQAGYVAVRLSGFNAVPRDSRLTSYDAAERTLSRSAL